MLRRTLRSVLLGVAVLGGSASAVGPAHGEATCTLTPPARVVINAPEVDLTATVTGGCSTDPGILAFWHSAVGAQDSGGFAGFDSDDPPAEMYFDDSQVRYGVSQWLADGVCRVDESESCNGIEDYPQSASATSDVRRGTVAGVAGSRSGGTVDVAGSSFVYSTSAHRQVHRSAVALWQVQERTGTTWRTVRNLTTPVAGITRERFYGQPAGRKYRFVLPATPSSWTGISRVVAP